MTGDFIQQDIVSYPDWNYLYYKSEVATFSLPRAASAIHIFVEGSREKCRGQ
jgi:hypothetical protein